MRISNRVAGANDIGLVLLKAIMQSVGVRSIDSRAANGFFARLEINGNFTVSEGLDKQLGSKVGVGNLVF